MQQNFLRHERSAREIVERSGVGSKDLVVEFGAGAGTLTHPLSRKAGRVLAVEYDPRWAEHLQKRFARDENVLIVCGDALETRLPQEPYRVVANLPFHITTEVLRKLLDDPRSSPASAHLLVQEEVATKHARDSPTTLAALSWSPWHDFSASLRFPPQSFYPVPDASGRILEVSRRRRPLVEPESREEFRSFTRKIFTGKGRGVGGKLRAAFTKKQVSRLAKDIGFDPDSPPSKLDVRQWARVFAFREEVERRT